MRTLFLAVIVFCVSSTILQAQSAWTYMTEINGQEIGYVYDIDITSNGLIHVFSSWKNPETGEYIAQQFLYQDGEWHTGPGEWAEHGYYATAGLDGNLWFRTYYTITRYDGTTSTTWDVPEGLQITCLAVEPDGTAWCSTYGGVCCLKDSSWTLYTTDDGLAANHTTFITVSPDGIPWIRYGDPYQADGYAPACGVSYLQDDTWITFDESNGLIDNVVNDIVFGANDSVYISYRVSGISLYDGINWQTVSNRFGWLLLDSDGRLWMSYAEWLWMYNGISTSDNLWPYDVLEYIALANPIEVDEKLWLGTGAGIAVFNPDISTGIDDRKSTNQIAFSLLTNYPNPFNPATTISFTLSESVPVTLVVYSVTGQKVATLADGILPAGMHEMLFDGSWLSSGKYIARLTAGNSFSTVSMLLLK